MSTLKTLPVLIACLLLASTTNSQTTSQPTTAPSDTTVLPITYQGRAGAFITQQSATKIISDYALLRRFRGHNRILKAQIAAMERVTANKEAVNRSLTTDLAASQQATTLAQQNATLWQGRYEGERSNNRKTIVRSVVATVAVGIITGLLGYGYGRLSK